MIHRFDITIAMEPRRSKNGRPVVAPVAKEDLVTFKGVPGATAYVAWQKALALAAAWSAGAHDHATARVVATLRRE